MSDANAHTRQPHPGSTPGSTSEATGSDPDKPQSGRPVHRFLAVFLVVLLTLFVFELTPAGQRYLVIPVTSAIATVSVGLISVVDENARASGKVIWNPSNGFGVAIEAGCNGVEASILLIAAILAFPSTWGQKLGGILIGVATVQALNLARIISLFYIGQWDPAIFEWAHLYIWQALIMLDVLIVFLLWLRFVLKKTSARTRSAAA
jgi:exosortase H (IPTLxxWG-CTERM-specific)